MIYNQILNDQKKVLNHEGAECHRVSPEMELYTLACSMAMSPKFYEMPQAQIDRLVLLMRNVDAEYVARLAVYVRTHMGLRSVPLLMAVELARLHSGDNLVSRMVEKVVVRADEIAELLMCYQWRNPSTGIKKLGRLSNQIRTGLQHAFNQFDEYQFAKYDNKQLNVKLRDALFIVHPKPKDDEQQKIFDKIANDQLQIPYTWETELSRLGQQAYEDEHAREKAFRQKWEELVVSGKLGYMALLRNLRNILNAGVGEDVIRSVADRIADEHEVARARQFPFRYLSAYKELLNVACVHTPLILNALEDAAIASSKRILGINPTDRVMLACDMSGSMQHSLSRNGSVQYYEVGNMLAMLLQHRASNVISGIFADEWKVTNLPQKSILSNVHSISQRIGEVGYGTYGGKPIEWLIAQEIVVDKVMFFTDCQFWGNSDFDRYFTDLWEKYKCIAPNARLYLFDLAGHGQMPIEIPRRDVTLIAGWSDRIFDMLASLDNGENLVEEIMKVEL